MWDNKSIAAHLIPLNGIQIQQHMIIHSECQQNTFLILFYDWFISKKVGIFFKSETTKSTIKKKKV